MFKSKTLTEHLLRGLLGIAAFALSGILSTSHPIVALALIPVAFVALRGCPTCWTVGLFQTIAAKLRGTSAPGACVDGSCAGRARTTAARSLR